MTAHKMGESLRVTITDLDWSAYAPLGVQDTEGLAAWAYNVLARAA